MAEDSTATIGPSDVRGSRFEHFETRRISRSIEGAPPTEEIPAYKPEPRRFVPDRLALDYKRHWTPEAGWSAWTWLLRLSGQQVLKSGAVSDSHRSRLDSRYPSDRPDRLPEWVRDFVLTNHPEYPNVVVADLSAGR